MKQHRIYKSSYEQSQASALVGKAVIMQTTSSTTGEHYTAGYVDAVVMSNGKPYLYINGSYYALSDLNTVLDDGIIKSILKESKGQ